MKHSDDHQWSRLLYKQRMLEAVTHRRGKSRSRIISASNFNHVRGKDVMGELLTDGLIVLTQEKSGYSVDITDRGWRYLEAFHDAKRSLDSFK